MASGKDCASLSSEQLLAQFDSTKLVFFVNGQRVEVPSVDPRTTLATFLRNNLNLRGTKIGCNEGGCGACTVMVSDVDPVGEKIRHFSVNSCLTPVCSVFGKAVTTVEGIAAGYERLHPVQERLSRSHGSQCGYCTPGFVMAMYTLLRNQPQPSTEEVDECLQGNLCRCTGYRPILEAFYSFAEPNSSGVAKPNEEEDFLANGCCEKGENCCMKNGKSEANGQAETPICKLADLSDAQQLEPSQELIFPPQLKAENWHRKSFAMEWEGFLWLQPTSLAHLLALKRKLPPSARLMAGNTEIGVELKFRHIDLRTVIGTKQIPELRSKWADEEGIWLGMGLSLNEVKMALREQIRAESEERTAVFRAVLEMLHLFAGQHVRNMASIAGNIATASPISDLNPVWMASGAQILVESEARGKRRVELDEAFFPAYRKCGIGQDELIRAIRMPFSSPSQFFRVFKQAQRREDDIAIVAGAFLVEFEEEEGGAGMANGSGRNGEREDGIGILGRRVARLRMAFGGVGPTTRLAAAGAEAKGMEWDEQMFGKVSRGLAEQFSLAEDAPGGMAKFRQILVLSFFLKFFLFVREQLEKGAKEGGEEELMGLGQLEEGHFHATQVFQPRPDSQSSWDPVGRPLMHASGEKHTTGEAVYTTDVQMPPDCLFLAYVQSPVACGTLKSVDFSKALEMPGVVGTVDWRDVPGSLFIGHAMDTPLFVKDKISHEGQPIAAILAKEPETARRAAALVRVELERGEKPLVTIEDAIEQGSFLFPQPFRIHSSLALPGAKERVDVDWAKFGRVVEGQIRVGGQEHFYLETHNCLVIPGEGPEEMALVSSTQSVNDVQGDVALALGVPRNGISVSVRRIGGGFGGKESVAGFFAAATAVAARKFKRPVRFWLERFDDMAISGNRHPFRFDYRLALDEQDKLAAMEVNAFNNCGYSLDMSQGVMVRAMVHIDNVYKFANLDVFGHLCRTNLASNTAFRGFGGPQAMFATEAILKHAAEEFGLDPDELRWQNMYSEGQSTHFGMHLRQCNIRRCWAECREWAELERRRQAVGQWNARNRFIKRGIYMVPTKFGIAFGFKRLNQAGALVNVYTDGSVLIAHGGMEMGQGLHTKILQIASRSLGIPISLIKIIDTATDKVPNASPTAASVGSDVNGLAVQNACQTILQRLEPLRKELPEGAGWKELVEHAYISRVQLSATGFGIIHCEPVNFVEGRGAEYYGYFVYGVGCAEVEVDCLTGDHRVLRVDIVMDVGESLNPAVDIGQIEGAFVQGYGMFTMEELKVRPDGTRLTRGPGTYKIPSADDAPRQFHVKLLSGSSNKSGIFSSKAIGEPPTALGSAAFFAIREAVRAYRLDNGREGYFRMDSPASPERVRMACEDGITKKATSKSAAQPWTVEL